jgi:hypothetical protein
MALSNWDTLVVGFRSREWLLDAGDPQLSSESAQLTERLDRMIAQVARDPEATQRLLDSVEYGDLFAAERESRTRREIDLLPCDSTFTDPTTGWEVRLRKNWLYLGSADRHLNNTGERPTPREPYVDGTLIQLNDGFLNFGYGFEVHAVRGPQLGVFFAAWTNRREDRPAASGSRHFTVYEGMVGCGVSGYDGDRFVGVQPESVEFLRQWLATLDCKAVGCVDLTQARRFNPGDRLFAAEYGIDTPASAPGEADSPLLSDASEGLNADR